ncbi:MAG: [FeFe] hydrogenase H-cluster radical SAM maturase HydG [Spirochaetes bacterium]|nr:[FeFe] hydrogenase H-cluster radical SAM maturase HydG [Spirochaetota bacterium]
MKMTQTTEKNFIDREKLYTLSDVKYTDSEIDTILNKALRLKGISVEEAGKLINVTDSNNMNKIMSAAGKVKDLIYGKRLVLFAPLYVGNKCSNNCLYCAFRKDNKDIKRVVLSENEIIKETELLLKEGHKRVLLIGGEAGETRPDYYIEAMRAIYSAKYDKHTIRRVNVEIAPMETAEFEKFSKEQIGTYICFQETYDEVVYKEVHPSGKKKDFNWRLYVMDRALQGGLNDVGIGALFGLADYRFETLALLTHANHLDETFGVGPHTVSVPRIEPATNAPLSYQVPHPVSDENFKKIVAVIRLALPYTGIILSTRENETIRKDLFHYGISQISAGSRTNPGGYSDNSSEAQFSLGDHRSLDEVISSLIDDGYIPSFCTGCYRKGRVGKDFMDIAKPGLIHKFCMPNGLFTFKEYLEDFATPETKAKGEKLLTKLISEIEDAKIKEKSESVISQISNGERDIYL